MYSETDCLDASPGESCEGPTEYRYALSSTGKSYPRCDKHWNARVARQREIQTRYPDTPNAPAWFDPTYAGERWDDD